MKFKFEGSSPREFCEYLDQHPDCQPPGTGILRGFLYNKFADAFYARFAVMNVKTLLVSKKFYRDGKFCIDGFGNSRKNYQFDLQFDTIREIP